MIEKRRADGLLVEAKQLTRKAEREQSRAISAEKLTRRVVYAADIARAEQAIQEGNIGFAEQLLERHDPDSDLGEPDSEDLRGFEWHYLKRRCQTAELTIRVPDLRAAVFFNQDAEILVGNGQGRLLRFDSRSGQPLGEFDYDQPDELFVIREMFLHEDKLLVLGFQRGIVVLDMQTHEVVFKYHGEVPSSICLSRSGRELAWILHGKRGDPRLWTAQLDEGEPREIEFSADSATAIQYQGDESLLVGDWDGNLWRYDLAKGVVEQPVPITQVPIQQIRVFAGYDQIVVASQTEVSICRASDLGLLRQKEYRVEEYQVQTLLGIPQKGFGRVTFSDGNQWVDWHYESEPRGIVHAGHSSEIVSLCCGRNANRTLSASRDGTVRIWNPNWNPPSTTRTFGNASYSPVSFDRSGQRLLMASFRASPSVAVVDAKSGEIFASLEIDEQSIDRNFGWSQAFHPAGKQVAIAFGQRRVQIWDGWEAGDDQGVDNPAGVVTTLQEGCGDISQLKYSPSGRYLVVPKAVKGIRVWDFESKTWRRDFDSAGITTTTAISPDDRYLAQGVRVFWTNGDVSQEKFQIHIWEIETGKLIQELDSSLGSIDSNRGSANLMKIDSDNRLLAGGFNLEMWNIESGELLGRGERLKLIDRTLRTIEVSEDGERAFIGTNQGACEVWDLVTFRKLATLRDVRQYAKRFSALFYDERGVLISSGQYGVQLWDGTPQ